MCPLNSFPESGGTEFIDADDALALLVPVELIPGERRDGA